MSTYTIRAGDTLSGLARRHGVTVAALRATSIADPNRILAGATLVIPDTFGVGSARSVRAAGDEFCAAAGTYPTFRQGDPQWSAAPMGTGGGRKNHIGALGCAMAAATMALDGITGQKLTPAQMNDFMRKHGGYTAGGTIRNWQLMGKAVTPSVDVRRRPEGSFGPSQVDAELDAGRPVMVHVDYHGKHGAKAPDGIGDHWILVTAKTADGRYQANDPASGKQISLHQSGNRLVADGGKPYRSTGGAVTFSRGPDRTDG